MTAIELQDPADVDELYNRLLSGASDSDKWLNEGSQRFHLLADPTEEAAQLQLPAPGVD